MNVFFGESGMNIKGVHQVCNGNYSHLVCGFPEEIT